MPDTQAATEAADAASSTASAPEQAPARDHEIPAHLLDPDAIKVVRHLRRSGFKAYLVGGCVRDLLLGHRPKDFDVATSAHPHQVKESFRNCRLIGRRFRLAHVYFRGGKVIEVSTFRANPIDAIVDGAEGAEIKQDLLIRHDNVFGNEEEDARRRDFTINGLFYDLENGQVVDHVGGKTDLYARSVRTIGNPDVRMREDPVRILRAIRFAAKCGLTFEPETLAAMKAHAQEIPRCAPPRVLEELLKLTRSGSAKRCVELMREVGVLNVLLPPIDAVFTAEPDSLERHLRALDALDAHVRVDEVPSDAVLLSTLLSPLPRSGSSLAPIPKAAHPADANATPVASTGDAADAPDAPVEAEDADEIDPELEALNRRLAEEASAEESDDEGDDDADDDADGDASESSAPESAPVAAADSSDGAASAAATSSTATSSETALSAAAADAATHAPFPSDALRSLSELHDERLAASGIPTFSVGGQSTPWSLPRGIVSAEVVLSEMVSTARLPRRIAERARLILSVQGILSGEKKRRKFSAAQFARESIFPEALAVFELNAAATGKGIEALARWQAIFLGQPVAELQIEVPREGGDRPRRRRRGGRGRRGGKSS